MKISPENRLTVEFCQEMIAVLGSIRKVLGAYSDGAVITRGNNMKFFCTVGATKHRTGKRRKLIKCTSGTRFGGGQPELICKHRRLLPCMLKGF